MARMITEQERLNEPRLLAKDVRDMSDEELDAAVEQLRGIRSRSPQKRKAPVGREQAAPKVSKNINL